jgi:ABC-2 type transport system permease protein
MTHTPEKLPWKFRGAALAKKEIFSCMNSPAFWGAAVFFLLFCSIWLFYLQRFFAMDMASLRAYFAAFPVVFILIVPVITMKSWAEERKTGSVEILLTMPFSEWDLVLGKFISSLGMLAAMLVFTIPLPLSLFPLGDFDGGVIFTEYLGAFLLGSSASALGLLLSCLSKNQAGSFLGGAAVLMAAMFIHQLASSFNLPRFLADGINFISLSFHFESFARGLVDTRDLAFFVLTTVLFLYLNTRVLIYRKWS